MSTATNSKQKSKLNITSDFDMQVFGKRFTDYSSYTADVYTNAAGGVSGGGTRTTAHHRFGFTIHIRNDESETRRYGLRLMLFTDVPNKIVQREITANTQSVKPGYTATLDIETLYGEDSRKLYLEDIYVKDAANVQLAHYEPNAHMNQEALLTTPTIESVVLKRLAPVLLCAAIGGTALFAGQWAIAGIAGACFMVFGKRLKEALP